jgi:pimeloyl-ACP methyl ester carboxylesterase
MALRPELLGNANGLPAEVRDEANRIVLAEDYRTLTEKKNAGTLTEQEAKALANIERVKTQIEAREQHRDPLTGQPVPVQLYVYDPYAFDGDGRVAIATGNLDEADHVAVTVPGVGSSVQGLSAGAPHNIYDQSRRASGEDVAVLDWMGYDSPNAPGSTQPGDVLGLLTDGMADEGAQRLASDVAGLRASRVDDPAHLTVIGSSYGSTTAGMAAAEYGLQADDLVLVGSPGIDADNAGELTTGHGHTWVGSASQDPITGIGSLSPDGDPAEEGFGGHRFRAELPDRYAVNPMDNHGGYTKDDSEGLFNIGAIVTERYGDVREAQRRPVEWGKPDPEAFRQPQHGGH